MVNHEQPGLLSLEYWKAVLGNGTVKNMLKYTGKAGGTNGQQCSLLDDWPTDCEAPRLPSEKHELSAPVPAAPAGDGKEHSAGEMWKSNFRLFEALLISLSLRKSLVMYSVKWPIYNPGGCS